jgi:Flp pilus assembly pilin Flp
MGWPYPETYLDSIDNASQTRHYVYTILDGNLHVGYGGSMFQLLRNLWSDEEGQDIAEYAVMLAVILVLVIGTVRLIGGNANNVFSSVANSVNTQ